MMKVGKSDGEGTFADRAINGGKAPIPAVRRTAMEPRGPTLLAIPADHRVDQEAVIRVRLLGMPTADSRQLIEQPLRCFQIGGAEALGEPAVNGREQLARLGPPPLFTPQPREARRGT